MVSSHRVTVTSSHGTLLPSTRASQDGQIMLRRRMNPRSFNQLLQAQEGVDHCLSLTPWTNSRDTGALTTLCCQSFLTSSISNRMEVPSTGSSGTFGQSHAWKTRWKTASTSSRFTTPWSGSSWTWPMHSTPYQSVRLSGSSCAERWVLDSSSSKLSAWAESYHPTSGAGLQRPLVAWYHQSSAAASFVARSTWMTASWLLEEALMKFHAPSLSRCWPSPSWVFPSLGTSIGDRVVLWIGAQLSVEDFGISVAIPQDKLDALHRQTSQFLSATIAQKKALPSFCSKHAFVDGMVWVALASSSPVAVGTRPLSAVPSGALVVAGSLLRGSWFLVRLSGSSRSQQRGAPRPLHCHRCVPLGFCWCLVGEFQACGVVRYSTDKSRSSQIQGQRRVVQAQHHLGSPRPPRGRCGHDCQVHGPWRASGVIHCQRSRAWCGSTATPPTSMLLPRNLPQTPSWACTQWSSRLTSGVYLVDYLMICHGCGPSVTPSTAAPRARATATGSRSGSLVLETHCCKAQARWAYPSLQ